MLAAPQDIAVVVKRQHLQLCYRFQLPAEAPLSTSATPDIRYLGEQRCESCGGFMQRLGYGGLCPFAFLLFLGGCNW